MKTLRTGSLLGSRKRAPEFVDELSLDRTFAGLTIGDNWVAVAKAHVDVLGPVYPIRWEHEFLETRRGTQPSARAIRTGIRDCWLRLNAEDDTAFSKMFVCLPAWACRTRDVKCHMLLGARERPEDYAAVITEQDVRQLVEKTVSEYVETGFVAAECMPRYFVVGNGRRVDDPVGELSGSLSLKAHLVLADTSIVEAIRDTLHDLGVDIDVMTSPYSVARRNLPATERDHATLLVDVDRFSTSCSFICNGQLVRMSWVPAGSSKILEGAAAELEMESRELADWVNEWEEQVRWAKLEPDDPAPAVSFLSRGPQSWEELDEAASPSARELFDLICERLRFANALERIHVGRIVFAGDDYLTLRALKQAGQEYLGIPCSRLVPEQVYNAENVDIPGLARMIGLVRQEEHLVTRAQPYLAESKRDRLDRMNEWLKSASLRLARSSGRLLLDLLKKTVRGLSTFLTWCPRGIWRATKSAWSRRPSRKSGPSRRRLRDHVLIR